MAKNKLEDLRNLMFEAAERLLDPEEGDKFDVKKAQALAGLSQQIIDGAKLEFQYLKEFGGQGTRFFDVNDNVKQIEGRNQQRKNLTTTTSWST